MDTWSFESRTKLIDNSLFADILRFASECLDCCCQESEGPTQSLGLHHLGEKYHQGLLFFLMLSQLIALTGMPLVNV